MAFDGNIKNACNFISNQMGLDYHSVFTNTMCFLCGKVNNINVNNINNIYTGIV